MRTVGLIVKKAKKAGNKTTSKPEDEKKTKGNETPEDEKKSDTEPDKG